MQIPIDNNLFKWPDDFPHLMGSRCSDCETVNFPTSRFCPACCGNHIDIIALATRGTLWSWTVQNFPPKAPPYAGNDINGNFKSYGVGYIELANQLRIESRLTLSDCEQLEIGMEMELQILPFSVDEAGNEIMTYAFAPIQD